MPPSKFSSAFIGLGGILTPYEKFAGKRDTLGYFSWHLSKTIPGYAVDFGGLQYIKFRSVVKHPTGLQYRSKVGVLIPQTAIF